MVLLLDNYDSFTWNLVRAIAPLVGRVEVMRNDRVTVEQIAAIAPSHLVISPGPRGPSAAGVSLAAVRAFAGRIPILGVCLGHQCVNEAFGGATARATRPLHGKTSRVRTDGRTIFAGAPTEIEVCRYHSLVADPARLGEGLEVTAWSEEGEVMGLRHRALAIEGVQFHPESFRTPWGPHLLRRFFEVYA
ncbi:MAG: anthranilate synthase component II [Myxococcota bacterium]